MIISGIYKIQSIIKPDRSYIGSSSDIYKRWKGHLILLNAKKHHSKKLQNHYNKYGTEDLMFSIISECPDFKLLSNEQFYIELHLPYFNNCKVAGSCFGRRHSEETKAILREKNIGKIVSAETRLKISIANTGRKHTELEKRNMSESHKGKKPKPITEETRLKMRKNNIGKTLSEETKRKISESNKGKHGNIIYTDALRKKMSESAKIARIGCNRNNKGQYRTNDCKK